MSHGVSAASVPGVAGREPTFRLLAVALLTLPPLWLWGLYGRDQWVAVSDGFYYLVTALALYWAVRGIRRPWSRAGATAAVIAGWLLVCLVGDAIWTYESLIAEDGEAPFPSLADAVYLVGPLLLGLATLLLPTRPLSLLLRGRILLDGLIAILGVCTFSWYFYLGPLVLDDETDLLARAVGVAYPLSDLMLVCCLWLLSTHGGRSELQLPLRYLLAAVTLLVVGDTYYGIASLHDAYNPAADAVFLVTNGLLGIAAGQLRHVGSLRVSFREEAMRQSVRSSILQTQAPYALVPCLLVLLAWVAWAGEGGYLSLGVYIGAGLCFMLVLFRQMVVLQENLRLYRELHEAAHELEALACTDALTGLPNRRPFLQALARHLGPQTAESISLVMLDVDRFKEFNDTYGHPAGDQVLAQLAALLRAVVPPDALPARYGGEEFAIVVPGIEASEAEQFAERVRIAVEATHFPHRRMTVSLGVVTVKSGMNTEQALIDAADAALYAAKRAGRNRVVVAPTAADPRCAA